MCAAAAVVMQVFGQIGQLCIKPTSPHQSGSSFWRHAVDQFGKRWCAEGFPRTSWDRLDFTKDSFTFLFTNDLG